MSPAAPAGSPRMDLQRPICLSERQWERVQPLLPAPARTGRPRADDRQTVEAIIYVLRTGCRWQDLPREYGAPVTAWLGAFRRLLIRWERLVVVYRAFFTLALIQICLRRLSK